MAAPQQSFWGGTGAALASGGLTMFGGGLEGLGRYLAGAADRKWTKGNRKEFDRLAPMIEAGISQKDILSQMPLINKSVMPFVNKFAAGGAAKFGSRSGYSAGAAVKAHSDAATPLITQAMMRRIFTNFASKQYLLGARGNMAGQSTSGLAV